MYHSLCISLNSPVRKIFRPALAIINKRRNRVSHDLFVPNLGGSRLPLNVLL